MTQLAVPAFALWLRRPLLGAGAARLAAAIPPYHGRYGVFCLFDLEDEHCTIGEKDSVLGCRQ